MKHSELEPDDLNRPDWNSLKANYDKHDVGEAYFVGRAHQMGLHVEHWGIDMRDHDDHLIFDDKMDLRLWEPAAPNQAPPPRWPSDSDPEATPHKYRSSSEILADEITQRWTLAGVADVKTKANPSWFGKFNFRHLLHYADWAREYNVPVFLFFTIVNMDEERVGERNAIVPLEPFDTEPYHEGDAGWGQIVDDVPAVQSAFEAPDGNAVVDIDEAYYEDFDWFADSLR